MGLHSVFSKDVRLPVQMQRAMAAEAESSREARAKVSHKLFPYWVFFHDFLSSADIFQINLFFNSQSVQQFLILIRLDVMFGLVCVQTVCINITRRHQLTKS